MSVLKKALPQTQLLPEVMCEKTEKEKEVTAGEAEEIRAESACKGRCGGIQVCRRQKKGDQK